MAGPNQRTSEGPGTALNAVCGIVAQGDEDNKAERAKEASWKQAIAVPLSHVIGVLHHRGLSGFVVGKGRLLPVGDIAERRLRVLALARQSDQDVGTV